jgi:predicted Zn-dependent protease
VGRVLFDLEMWSYAELAFHHAADVAAPFPEAMAYVGLARDRQGKDGSEWVKQAVTLAPDNARVLYVQALHLRHVGDDAGSVDILIRAIALEPDNPALYAELGTSYRLIGDLSRAEYWLKNAVLFSNNAPEFEALLTTFYTEQAQTAESLLAGMGAVTPDSTDVISPSPENRTAGGEVPTE